MLLQHHFYVVVDRKHCQKFRELLGDNNVFDKRRKVLYEEAKVKLPVKFEPNSEMKTSLESVSDYLLEVATGTEMETVPNSLYDHLENWVIALFNGKVTDSLKAEIPNCWENYGDLLLIPGTSFKNKFWNDHRVEILEAICDIFKVKRIARKKSVINDQFRSPKTEMLQGKDTWVFRRENKITLHFDITRSMFSIGNISEKLRVAKFNCQGETVVDLFAGIGYWVLPFLVHAKAEHVIACEWNPASVTALRYNLEQHGLVGRCTVLEGDNRDVCPEGEADRVSLGLIPSSEVSWRTACLALRDRGGLLHIHGNVETTKEQPRKEAFREYAEAVREKINVILNEVKKKEFCVSVSHIECIKSYAPRIFHLVVDLTCENKC